MRKLTLRLRRFALALLLISSVILLSYPALQAPYEVRLVRDAFGVPHIYAPTDEGALFGFGYAQAEDHLLDMLQNYLTVEGRMAELFGEDYLESDIQARALLNYRDEELLQAVDSKTLFLVSAFAQGVDRYIEEHQAELPEWARSFEVAPAQVLRFTHFVMLSRALSVARQEFRQGPASAVAQGPLEAPPFTEASNQWVVGASRTQDGAPIFLMNPHLPWSGMNRWYEAHLVGATLNVYGATFYGSPFIAIGHNGRIAWSMTHNNPDLADIFVEELHPDDPMRYRTESGWEEMAVRKEVFRIQGGEPVTREIYYTRNGWVVSLEPERNRALVVAAEEALPQIFEAYEAAPPERHQALTPAIELLRRWNRRADVEQSGMTLFYFWWHRPEGEREQDPLQALEAAISEMEGLYGTIEVPWGEIHRIRRGEWDLPIAGEQRRRS